MVHYGTLEEMNYLVMRLNGLVPPACRVSDTSFSNPKVRETWHYALYKGDTGYILKIEEQYKASVVNLTNALTKREMYQALYSMVNVVERMPIDVFHAYTDRLHCSECAGRCT